MAKEDAIREALAANRQAALKHASAGGSKAMRVMLEQAQSELQQRIDSLAPSMVDTFTAERMRSVLAQVRLVLRQMQPRMLRNVVDAGSKTADLAVQNTIDFLKASDDAYRGVGTQPLALDEARMFDAAAQGSKTSMLRRLVTDSGTPESTKTGILQRYGTNTIGFFERVLQQHVLQRTSWEDVKERLRDQSPFLQGAPAHWAERIARTETAAAYNRATWESHKEADEQLDDAYRIVVATFDHRTGADSYNQHGQARGTNEAFEYVADDGSRSLYMHPPNRPNDREVVVMHRKSWPMSKGLLPLSDGKVASAYAKAKKKFPGRPLMSTV